MSRKEPNKEHCKKGENENCQKSVVAAEESYKLEEDTTARLHQATVEGNDDTKWIHFLRLAWKMHHMSLSLRTRGVNLTQFHMVPEKSSRCMSVCSSSGEKKCCSCEDEFRQIMVNISLF